MTTGARSEKSTAPVSRWNLRLGRFLGIDVYVHGTFLMLLGFLALAHWLPTRSVWAATSGVVFFVALFGCVLLHEYGHALAARYFGIGTRDITLMPMGGVARLERMPDRPTHELWIALAGPAVNVVIAAALGLGLWSVGALAPLSDLGPARGHFAQRLLVVNVFLVLFNMIPAFPMDGGRVLRALLAMRMELVKATRIAARLGQAIAVVFGFAAFLGNPMLFLIAVFVWLGASTELRAVEAKSALEGFKVSQAMMTQFIALDPKDPIERAVREIMDGVQQDFPVVENSRVIGMLERRHLMEGLAKLGCGTPVEAIMLRDFPTLNPGDPLTSVLTRHSLLENPMMPVVSGERLVGLLTTDNVTELLLIQSALQGSGGLGVWAAKPVFPVDREWCEKPIPWRPVAGGWEISGREAPPVIRPVGRE